MGGFTLQRVAPGTRAHKGAGGGGGKREDKREEIGNEKNENGGGGAANYVKREVPVPGAQGQGLATTRTTKASATQAPCVCAPSHTHPSLAGTRVERKIFLFWSTGARGVWGGGGVAGGEGWPLSRTRVRALHTRVLFGPECGRPWWMGGPDIKKARGKATIGKGTSRRRERAKKKEGREV